MHEDDAPRVAGLDEPDEFVMARMGAEIELLPLALDVDRDAVHVDHALLDEPPPVRPFDLIAGEQDGAARVLSDLLQISEDGTAIERSEERRVGKESRRGWPQGASVNYIVRTRDMPERD